MSGNVLRIIFCVFLSVLLVACGGGGGGGSKSQPDTDKDGTVDAQDAFPNDPKEWLDTDKDGVGDNSDLFPNDPKETKDTDKDGVGDNTDVFPNDPKETKDTDKDGVGDNADAFPNDPAETKDTDKDGVGDNADVFPNDPAESLDADKDGIGDNADPTPLGQAIPAWPTFQGGTKHLGKVDVALAVTDFKQRWEKPVQMTNVQQGAAGDGYIFFNNGGVLYALSAHTGETLWSRSLNHSFGSYDAPAYSDGIVYVKTSGSYPKLSAFNSVDGSIIFEVPVSDSSRSVAPSIIDGTIYFMNWYYNNALDAKTGSQKWLRWSYTNSATSLTVTDNYVLNYSLNYYSAKLLVMNRFSGSLEFEIEDSISSDVGVSNDFISVVSGDIVLGNYRGRLSAFNLADKKLLWNQSGSFTGQPVVKDDRFYIINNGVLETRALATGELLETITGTLSFSGNLLATNNLIFVRDTQNIYAYTLATGALAWTLANKAGDMLLAEGALVVFTANGVMAVDVEGDIDADGLPDWWEKRYQKNINPAADIDKDGLTGLEEFTNSTNPLVADIDGDKLLDGEEITNKTSPYKADSDGDGIDDYLEVKTYLTDPTKVDSDGDTLRDNEEIAAGLNPLDATDALADKDGDGFSNLFEVQAGTGVNDAASKPQMTEWSTRFGNLSRNSYLPRFFNDTHFSERWTISYPLNLSQPVIGAGRLIASVDNSELIAFDTGTGEEVWQKSFPGYGVVGANTYDDKLIFFAGNNAAGYNLTSVNAATGNSLYSQPAINNSFYGSAPLVSGNKVYHINSDSRSFKAYDLSSGNYLWTSATSTDYFSNDKLNLLAGDKLIGVGQQTLTIYSALNGTLIKTINPANSAGINNAVLGSKGNVILNTNSGMLMSVVIADGSVAWNSTCSANRLAVGNGKVYALGNGKLCVIDEQNGTLLWTLGVAGDWTSNLVLTAGHLFYSDGSKTHAVDLVQRSISWSINRGVAELFMGADGTLYLLNGTEITAIDTEGDTDTDGLPQWWERRYGGDLAADADPDSDELSNLEEFAAKTNPLVADTDGDSLIDSVELEVTHTNPLVVDSDKDGLSDGAEVNIHGSDPLLADSDGDGIDDGKEIAAGLDPADEDDSLDDNDSDGFTNREEINAGTDLANATSKPQVGDWATDQANAAHNGFQPYRLNSGDFNLRWQKTFPVPLKPIITGDRQVFALRLSEYGNQSFLSALNAVDGKERWKKAAEQPVYYHHSPVYTAGKVLLSKYSYESGIQSEALDSDQGAKLYGIDATWDSVNTMPVVVGTSVYVNGYDIRAVDSTNGTALWTANIGNYGTNIVANNSYVFRSYRTNSIVALDRTTGIQAFTINTHSNHISQLVLGSRNNILGFISGLTSFDIATRKINWRIPADSHNASILPAVGNGSIYYVGAGKLHSLNEVDGSKRWSWSPQNTDLNSNIVVTLSHVFVASSTETYALSAITGELEWTYDLGGELALGADGALYIRSDKQLVAINLEGDGDGDGLPDWWERHYGLNSTDDSDAALDLDTDGLTNLEEFTYGSYADQADSDNDGLNDIDEIGTHNTDPTTVDSDNDGINDGWEITNNLNPLDPADRDLDSDNDQVPNFFEYLEGTDPHNATSLPSFFSAGTYSFEDGQLPAGWNLSAQTTDVSVSSGSASHGTKALQLRQKADISFSGFFVASDLSLDIKSNCSGSYLISIYIDDQLMASSYAGLTWSTLKTVVPLGSHKVSIRSDSYSCALSIDNLIVAPAASNVSLGVQFVGLYDTSLRFVNAGGQLVRTVAAIAPVKNVTPRNLATLENQKVAVIFSGNTRHLGLLDLQTLNWRYFDIQDQFSNDYYYYSRVSFGINANYAYVPTYNPFTSSSAISRISLSDGTITRFGESHNYNSIAIGNDGSIYAHAEGVVYKYDAVSLTLLSQSNVIYANQILLDSQDRLIVAGLNTNEVVRYNAQRLIDARVQLTNSIGSIATNERNELIVTANNGQIDWYSSDWQRSHTIATAAIYVASFPQPDTDTDGIPDWWELAYGLNLADSADAASDSDADGLGALQEYTLDTNPALDDTDGDLLNDGDEVNDFNTNPNLVDTDGDGLTDAQEVLTHLTDPLKKDTDGDTFSDLLEITQFMTDPNDANSKPAALVNFQESFEVSTAGWLKPTGVNNGWSVSTVFASNGTKSLRSDPIDHNQTAVVEWMGIFNQSTLTFDARVSSESCCDYLIVYVDNQEVRQVRDTQGLWKTETIPMTQGVHTLRFVYRKDSSSVQGLDSALIDNIRVQ